MVERRSRYMTVIVGATLSALILLAGCSDDDPDPALERRERVMNRLEASYSRDQAACIVDKLDQKTIDFLVGGTDASTTVNSEPRSDEWANAVRTCVIGPEVSLPETTTSAAEKASDTD